MNENYKSIAKYIPLLESNKYDASIIAEDGFLNDFNCYLMTSQFYPLPSPERILMHYGIRWRELDFVNAKVNEMSEDAVLALIVSTINADRIYAGTLDNFFRNGTMLKWLHRLAYFNT